MIKSKCSLRMKDTKHWITLALRYFQTGFIILLNHYQVAVGSKIYTLTLYKQFLIATHFYELKSYLFSGGRQY